MSGIPHELPSEKLRRLSKEIAACLDEVNSSDMGINIHAAVIHPASSSDHPIAWCCDHEYAEMNRALFAYRAAYQAWWALKDKPRSNACREAQSAMHEAQFDLDQIFISGMEMSR